MGGCCSKDEKFEGLVWIEEDYEDNVELREGDGGARVRLHGSCRFASMYTQPGSKGINQDAMTLWEDFNGEKGTIFCSVFDGHGPLGHKVAGFIRDVLPSKLSQELKPSKQHDDNVDGMDESGIDINNDDDADQCHPSISSCKARFAKAFKEMDTDLYLSTNIDCFYSGTTAVSILKQGDYLTIANLGDSRAILCTRDNKNQLIPIQLTVDLKPNVPSEANRIKSSKGRIFAMEEEPGVYRLWLPNQDCPGLAMARAFGDFCLKGYGLISIPQVSHRKITERDEFVVLATDGVWDVLSNVEVVRIVASVKKRSMAAKTVVDHAVQAWKSKYPTSKIDDCAVICLFLKFKSSLKKSTSDVPGNGLKYPRPSISKTSTTGTCDGSSQQAKISIATDGSNEEWTALNGVSRVNSILKLPRCTSAGSRLRIMNSTKEEEEEDG